MDNNKLHHNLVKNAKKLYQKALNDFVSESNKLLTNCKATENYIITDNYLCSASKILDFFSIDVQELQNNPDLFGYNYNEISLEYFADENDGLGYMEHLCDLLSSDYDCVNIFHSPYYIYEDYLKCFSCNLFKMDYALTNF